MSITEQQAAIKELSESARKGRISSGGCDFNGTGIRIHVKPDVDSTPVGEGNPGDGVTFIGDFVGDFDHIRDDRTGKEGWVVYYYISCPG